MSVLPLEDIFAISLTSDARDYVDSICKLETITEEWPKEFPIFPLESSMNTRKDSLYFWAYCYVREKYG